MSAVKKEEALMTSEEMLERSSSWTLACDNALLNRLKRFSEDLTRNSQEILRECDSLSSTVTQLDYRLINVSNEFLMLSNTQFVENRVEEFEEFSSSVSSSSVPTIQKTKAEREAALLNKMKQAIHLGLDACNEKRQRNETSVNRFKMKQPYLIGSPKFFSSKYCGLVDETRREVPAYQDSFSMDSVSIHDDSVMNTPYNPTTQAKNEVKFTMPPTPVFPVKVPEPAGQNQNISEQHYLERQENVIPQRPVVPPSPTISNRSSDIGVGGDSGSSASKEHMPHSITDELNKLYSSFAPPPTGDGDSDDDFRPSTGVGRLFDDDDDDIFGEKELFPPNQKKNDFFGRSNLSQQLPAPVFSVPPPITPVPQSQPVITASDAHTAVGPKPETNDIPNTNSVTGNTTNNDVSVRGAKKFGLPPEAEGPSRTKLPPGAVSLFGGLPPPVFNNGTLQAAQTTNIGIPSLVAKPDTQISSQSSVEVESGVSPTFNRDNVVGPSQTREDVNHKSATSLPSHNITAPGRTLNISQGSLSVSGTTSSKAKTPQSVPVSSLFADESSDEDIFLSSKKQHIVNTRDTIQKKPIEDPPSPIVPLPKSNTVPVPVKTVANKRVDKSQIKKSIFDDSDSEDDLFSSKPSAPRVENKKKIATSDNDSLFKSDTFKTNSKQAIAKAPIKVSKSKSLFGDDSDSDTDLFGNKKKVEVKTSTLPSSSKASSRMEDVNVDSVLEKQDLFKEPEKQSIDIDTSINYNNHNNNNNNEDTVESTANEKSVIQSSSSESITSTMPAPTAQDLPKREEVKDARVKKSIFDDSESDDDLFSSKTKTYPNKITDKSDKLFEQKRSLPATNVDKGKRSSLFGDDSDSDSDLFGTKAKKTEPEKSEKLQKESVSGKQLSNHDENNVAKKEDAEVTEDGPCQQNADVVDVASLASKEPKNDIPNSCDGPKEEDEPKSAKVLGNKISEKIKAMQTTKITTTKTDSAEVGNDSSLKKNIKGKVSVKSLALNLNINPLALKVGAKLPKMSGSTPSTPTPDKDENEAPSLNDTNATLNAVPTLSSPDKPSLSVEEVIKSNSSDSITSKGDVVDEVEDENLKKEMPLAEKHLGVDDLVGILKARVKIQRKRRPPTRNFLKSLAVQVESETSDQQEQSSAENDEDVVENKAETTNDEKRDDNDAKIEEEKEENDENKAVESD